MSVTLPPRYADPRPIGKGGMGVVYAAKDLQLGRTVAIKVLSTELALKDDLRTRFQREALAAARLSGERHVVTIYDVGDADGQPFIVMEYIPGGSVADRLHAGAVSREQVLRWLTGTARALDAAHRRGVVHRDVKPGNLLLDGDDEVRVADFGIARVLGSDAPSVTMTGMIIGSSGYIAPERVDGQPAEAPSDIYALAAVAYELLTGVRPFAGRSTAGELAAHVYEDLPPATSRAPHLPPAVDAVLAHGMAKDPAERPPTAAAFVEALELALRDRGAPAGAPDETGPTRVLAGAGAAGAVASPRDDGPSSAPAPEPRRRGRGRFVGIAAALLLASGVAAGAVIATQRDGGDDPGVEAAAPPPAPAAPPAATPPPSPPPDPPPPPPPPPPPDPPPPPPPPDPPPPPPPPDPPPPPPPPPPPAAPEQVSVDQARQLNDQGFALMNQGDWAGALPLLQQSVVGLRGAGPGDPYEAYANYNLGITLLQLGRCSEAIPPLQVSDSLQDRTELDRALRFAQRCVDRGGVPKGNPGLDGDAGD